MPAGTVPLATGKDAVAFVDCVAALTSLALCIATLVDWAPELLSPASFLFADVPGDLALAIGTLAFTVAVMLTPVASGAGGGQRGLAGEVVQSPKKCVSLTGLFSISLLRCPRNDITCKLSQKAAPRPFRACVRCTGIHSCMHVWLRVSWGDAETSESVSARNYYLANNLASAPLAGMLLTSLALSSAPSLTPIARGQLLVVDNWLPSPLVEKLRTDATSLRANGAFVASGLSNTAKGGKTAQGFGLSDRAVCAIKPGLGGDQQARAEFAARLDTVRKSLSSELSRPGLVCAEQYYSISTAGASLARHMDEKHEEFKGARAWSSSYRRSVSWLAYLSEPGWDTAEGGGSGGALRAYVRDGVCPTSVPCGAHEGNLQVGWREREGGSGLVEPVFLDAWVKAPAPYGGWTSLAALYRVTAGVGDKEAQQREYISGAVEGGGAHTLDELYEAMSLAERKRFSRVEVAKDVADPPAGSSEARVQPLGGTLLLFDSVAVPHEVLETLSGERWAMAGWFHEKQQPVPRWFSEQFA